MKTEDIIGGVMVAAVLATLSFFVGVAWGSDSVANEWCKSLEYESGYHSDSKGVICVNSTSVEEPRTAQRLDGGGYHPRPTPALRAYPGPVATATIDAYPVPVATFEPAPTVTPRWEKTPIPFDFEG